MLLQFIDNTDIDRNARKAIRSHVAKGKNLGRKVDRPSRQKSIKERWIVRTVEPTHTPKHAEKNQRQPFEKENVMTIQRPVDDGFSTCFLPGALARTSPSLFHKAFCFLTSPVYPKVLSRVIAYDFSGSIWVHFLFQDEAYYHCSLASCLAVAGPRFMDQAESREAIKHLSQTFRLITDRLSGDDALSDLTLASVISMTHYDRLRGEYWHGLVHLNGLLRIVELRGGITCLVVDVPIIAQKVFRADLEFAIHLGTKTQLNVDSVPTEGIDWLRDKYKVACGNVPTDPELSSQVAHNLCETFEDCVRLAWLVKTTPDHGERVSGFILHYVLIHIGFSLLHINTLGGGELVGAVEDTIHLGSMAFLCSFLMGLGQTTPNYVLLSTLALSAFQGYVYKDRTSREVLLWGLVMGKITIFTSSDYDDKWIVPKIRELSSQLDLHSWEDALSMLAKFPWIDALHDEVAKALWDKAKLSRVPTTEIPSEPMHLLAFNG